MSEQRDKQVVQSKIERRYPIGAEVIPTGGTHFRVWVTTAKAVTLQFSDHIETFEHSHLEMELEPEAGGYFSAFVAQAHPGTVYKYSILNEAVPDPATRFQPAGPEGPSQVIDANSFCWQDARWRGLRPESQVIYELHVGTFTRAGTWRAAAEELPELARLGVTVLEIMPVADFVGTFGWGYDGVNLFAPTRLYGDPDDFRGFVDRAHALGLGVILDVVYNHIGPRGNYLGRFSEDYFSRRYENEWGAPLNFDDANSEPVREFFLTNAAYWIAEFHLDGLRLDATQQMFDSSANHILAAITQSARAAAGNRSVFLVAENEPQETKIIRPTSCGGFGVDAIWNDDFHHTAMVALTGRSEAYYTDYTGSPQEFISATKRGFLYQGQYYAWQKKSRGTPALDIHPKQFVAFLQNHDQIANSLRGQRLHQLTSLGRCKALTALLLLGPNTPMLFQGQEFAASSPFLYFADHDAELSAKVIEGRRKFLSQFRSMASVEMDPYIADPTDKDTFVRSKLDFADRHKHAESYRLHGDLLRLRKEDSVFSNFGITQVDGAVLAPEAFVLRFFGQTGDDRLLLVNLGRDAQLLPAPEPLLAPPERLEWTLLWSSEDPVYGGVGTPEFNPGKVWRIPGHAALVFTSQPRTTNATISPANQSTAGTR